VFKKKVDEQKKAFVKKKADAQKEK